MLRCCAARKDELSALSAARREVPARLTTVQASGCLLSGARGPKTHLAWPLRASTALTLAPHAGMYMVEESAAIRECVTRPGLALGEFIVSSGAA